MEAEEALVQWNNHTLDSFEVDTGDDHQFLFALSLFRCSSPADQPFTLDFGVKSRNISFGLRQRLKIEVTFHQFAEAAKMLRMVCSSSLAWDNMTALSIDRHALLKFVHAEAVFASVTNFTLVIGKLSSQEERHLTSIDWRVHLADMTSGRPRTLFLPSVRHVDIIEQVVTPDSGPVTNRLPPLLPAVLHVQRRPLPQPPTATSPTESLNARAENSDYGHGPVQDEIDRRVLLVAKLGPQILRHHISCGPSDTEFKLDKICISVLRGTGLHSLTMGVSLNQGYDGLASICEVEVRGEDAAVYK